MADGTETMWAAVADAWRRNADAVDARLAPVTACLLDRAAVAAGDTVLDLACGPGGTGIAAARRAGPGGHVTFSDIAGEMVEAAAARAAAAGLTDVAARRLDLEDIHLPDATADVALCRDGLMLVADPERAAREVHRVLRPGGRVAVAVWGPRAANPWLGALFDAVTEHTGMPVPPPGLPGPFSLADPDRLAEALRRAGFEDVDVTEVPTPFRAPSLEQWWAMVPPGAGPLALLLPALDDEVRSAIRDTVDAALRPHLGPAGLDIPGLNLVAAGHR